MSANEKVRLFDYEKNDWYFLAVLVALALWLFLPGLRPGRIMLPASDVINFKPEFAYKIQYESAFPVGCDINLEFQPWNDYACERLKSGEIPLWNPYNFCGTPFMANSLNQLTYIPRLILNLLLSTENVMAGFALLHFLLAGIGFYYLLKAYGAGPAASGVAAFIMMFKFSHPDLIMMPPMSLTLAYTGIGLLLAVKLIRGGRWLFALYLAVCLSCVISSGYPVFTAHFLYFGVALVLYEYFTRLKLNRHRANIGLIAVILGAIFGIGFSMTQLIPLHLQLSLSARPELWAEYVGGAHFSFKEIPLIIYQNMLFQPPVPADGFQVPPNFGNLYIGAIPIIFAIPLFGQWKNRNYRFFLYATIVASLICFWPFVFKVAHRLIPGFSFSPIPPFPVFYFCLIMLTGLTLGMLLKNGLALNRSQAVLLGIVSILLAVVPVSLPDTLRQAGDFRSNYILFLATLSIVFIALLLGLYRWKKAVFVSLIAVLCAVNFLPPMKQWTRFFGPEESLYLQCRDARIDDGLNTARYFNATGTAFLAANTNIYPRLRFAQGYDSLVLRDIADTYREYIPHGVIRGRRFVTKPGEAPLELLRIMGVGRVIHNPLYEETGTRKAVNGIQIITTDTGFKECSFTGGTCEMHRIKPERIEVELNPQTGGQLKIAEAYYPAWFYTTDAGGKARRVSKSDEGLIIIPDISAETHKVTLFYNPYLEKTGLWISAVSFLLGLALFIYLDRKKEGRHRKTN